MAKKVVGKIKLQIEAGKANPSPPVGPALGQHGVNIMDFCKQFNAKTESQAGYIIPVIIDVYEDRSFSFVIKSPPAPVLIKKALNLSKGSAVPNKDKVAEITREQLEEIAKIKMNDLNATTMEAAVKNKCAPPEGSLKGLLAIKRVNAKLNDSDTLQRQHSLV